MTKAPFDLFQGLVMTSFGVAPLGLLKVEIGAPMSGVEPPMTRAIFARTRVNVQNERLGRKWLLWKEIIIIDIEAPGNAVLQGGPYKSVTANVFFPRKKANHDSRSDEKKFFSSLPAKTRTSLKSSSLERRLLHFPLVDSVLPVAVMIVRKFNAALIHSQAIRTYRIRRMWCTWTKGRRRRREGGFLWPRRSIRVARPIESVERCRLRWHFLRRRTLTLTLKGVTCSKMRATSDAEMKLTFDPRLLFPPFHLSDYFSPRDFRYNFRFLCRRKNRSKRTRLTRTPPSASLRRPPTLACRKCMQKDVYVFMQMRHSPPDNGNNSYISL